MGKAIRASQMDGYLEEQAWMKYRKWGALTAGSVTAGSVTAIF